MYIFRKSRDVSGFLKKKRSNAHTIGFVPTMGTLHPGHLSLLERSKKECDISVCSIFINPSQFNNMEDFEKYPRVLKEDIELLERNKVDILFAPDVEDIYPDGIKNLPVWDVDGLDTKLEGAHRPGHFQGVCFIVNKLLSITEPDKLYMGAKDFQQVAIIQKLISVTKSGVELISCPTFREESGLAMSSRNRRLSEDARQKASAIYKVLSKFKNEHKAHSFSELKEEAWEYLKSRGLTPEHIELINAKTLDGMADFETGVSMQIVMAAFIEDVRLIDNISLT